MSRLVHFFRLGAPTAALVALFVPNAHADDAVAAAQSLFEQGRDLLRAGNFAQACPRLSESQRLDPAMGTLLALAMCHEGEGKLASAWAAFSRVADLAKREGHVEREQHARQRAAELKPRLSTLELAVSGRTRALEGVELTRNGRVLQPETWALTIPVDGGSHAIVVRAPGRKTFETTVVVARERDVVVVNIPDLPVETLTTPIASTPVVPPSGSERHASPQRTLSEAPSYSALEWTGVATAGAGLVALGVGGYFLFSALERKEAAKPFCDSQGCVEPGWGYHEIAERHGKWATGFGIGGAVLLAGGAALWFWGDAAEDSTRVSVAAGPRHAFIHVAHTF